MTTINIFIEQGEGIDVEFYGNIRGVKPSGIYGHFDHPDCSDIEWNESAFTREENSIIAQYLSDNYKAIENKMLLEAAKRSNYKLDPDFNF